MLGYVDMDGLAIDWPCFPQPIRTTMDLTYFATKLLGYQGARYCIRWTR